MKSLKNQKGFTLLEVVIVMTILAFLAIQTANSIKDGANEKKWIEDKLERETQLRDALAIIASDIRMAFNYRDINIEIFNLAQDQRKKTYLEKQKKGATSSTTDASTTDTGTTDTTGTQTQATGTTQTKQKTFEKKNEKILTHFLGTKEEIHFSSRSLRRTVEDSQSSTLGEVGYTVKPCRNRVQKDKQSSCLWRRIAPVIDDKVDEGGQETVLLENVERFELRYIGPQREEDWGDSWMTDERGDAITRNKFPYAVEITLAIEGKEVEGQDPKPLAMTVVSAIEFPNNIEKKTTPEGTTPAQQGTTAGATTN